MKQQGCRLLFILLYYILSFVIQFKPYYHQLIFIFSSLKFFIDEVEQTTVYILEEMKSFFVALD